MKLHLAILCLLIFAASVARAQILPADLSTVGTIEERKLASKLMAREVPYKVLLPHGYNISNETRRYPVIYLLHGLWGHFDNWTAKTRITEYAQGSDFIIVMPEGGDGWWTDNPNLKNDKYESYIIRELIPEIDKRFRTIADRGHRAIAGLSMGGYGAVKFGLKYPDLFSIVGSFSGVMDATALDDHVGGKVGASTVPVFGPKDNKFRRENDVFGMVRPLTADEVKKLPFIYESCGVDDPYYTGNRAFSALLQMKKVPHEFRELPGDHNWAFWDDQVREFLAVAARKIEN